MFRLSKRSLNRLEGVHPKLVAVVKRAIEITPVDFMVVEGLRTIEKQKEYVAKGVSKTMRSYHLKHTDGYGHAVDLAPLINGDIPWEDYSQFKKVASAMKKAALEQGVTITWGGDWKTFVDTPHFQLEV